MTSILSELKRVFNASNSNDTISKLKNDDFFVKL